MTTVSIKHINQQFNRLFARKQNNKQKLANHNISRQLMDYLKSVNTTSHISCRVSISLAARLINSLNTAINNGMLTLDDINDIEPSSKPQHIAISYERLTALLDEQGLDGANISPVQFSIIISKLFNCPKPCIITSAHSMRYTTTGASIAERRLAYLIPKQTFINTLKSAKNRDEVT